MVERVRKDGRESGGGQALGGRRQGAADLAAWWSSMAKKPTGFKFVYEEPAPLWDKMKSIAAKIYGASDITADSKVRAQIKKLQEDGYGHYPICVANANTRSPPTRAPRVRRQTTSSPSVVRSGRCGSSSS